VATETENALSALNSAQAALDGARGAAHTVQPWTPDLVRFLSVSILGFSVVALIMVTALLWRSERTPQEVLRIFGIMAIIGVSALLLVAGYSNDQLTPIVGLFGAIAGYLLGKDPATKKGEDR
jgi:hypothetical protein